MVLPANLFLVFAVVVVAASVFVVVAVVAAVVVEADASVVSDVFPVSAIAVVVVVSEAASPPKCFAALTEQTAAAGTQNSAAFVSWLSFPAVPAFGSCS